MGILTAVTEKILRRFKPEEESTENSTDKAMRYLEEQKDDWAKETNEEYYAKSKRKFGQMELTSDPYSLIRHQYREMGVPEAHLRKRTNESEERYIQRLTWTANAVRKNREAIGFATPAMTRADVLASKGITVQPAKGNHTPTPVVTHNTFSGHGIAVPGTPLSWSSGREEEKEAEPVNPVAKIPLEEYVGMIQSIPIVHKVNVLFDDRPNEVSIRVEYVENMLKLDPSIIADANEELTKVTHFMRIENCERIEITYMQKEVIT